MLERKENFKRFSIKQDLQRTFKCFTDIKKIVFKILWLRLEFLSKVLRKIAQKSLKVTILTDFLSLQRVACWCYVGLKVYICYLPAGGPYGEKLLPEAADRGQHFQARGHSFSPYGPTVSRQRTCLFFFPTVNWFYRLQMGLFTQLVIESACAPSTNDL